MSKRLIPGMFSSVSDAELVTEILDFETVEDNEDNVDNVDADTQIKKNDKQLK
ncbi:MAG TPA: hypothetical protein PKA28_07680 [Methylomusa anaerophila]|uniref:Uncharacterized protein n=1 Tax=Methylomusa anaerophila TaxID=1930071 RepID=A0A348AFW3_9FIRM|nr:hypothetical protein [Methylomusa anaerophila]BBB89961.1 hypothetical protein MAMMFC1_00602 [Methylomusa anaerophila]HML88312.1 hypothetical protein [Methylomusa anaerophila]